MPNRKNVIVFYTDQQRADSLGCMGNSLARTPNIDGLAAHGICYKQHYAANPVCMPSRAAFITGRYPQANGVLDNGVPLPAEKIDADVAMVQRKNVTTAGPVSGFHSFHGLIWKLIGKY